MLGYRSPRTFVMNPYEITMVAGLLTLQALLTGDAAQGEVAGVSEPGAWDWGVVHGPYQ